MRYPASGATSAPPAPYPITMIPVTRPLRSGNHFMPTERGHVQATPLENPTSTPKQPYSHARPFVYRERKMPDEKRRAPVRETAAGPRQSCQRPPAGTPAAMHTMNIVNAAESCERVHPNSRRRGVR